MAIVAEDAEEERELLDRLAQSVDNKLMARRRLIKKLRTIARRARDVHSGRKVARNAMGGVGVAGGISAFNVKGVCSRVAPINLLIDWIAK